MDSFWNSCPLIKEDLDYAVNIMEQNAKCKDKIIENSILELIHSGGKLLRPGFVLIASGFGSYDRKRAASLAAVVEMLHMATLVHDDIVDDSKLRRGNETIQSKYGKDYAVYIGDYLFCKCFKILSENSSLKAINVDSNSMTRICFGEIEQLNSRFDAKITVKSYLKRIASKTAELFSLSLYTGASSSGCSDSLSRKFWNIGHNIGMAFQIIDDILDYSGDEDILGKSPANDLKQGILTLPVLYAVAEKDPVFNQLIRKDYYTDQDIKEIGEYVRNSKALDKCIQLAKRYSDKAIKLIESLPENDNKEVLMEITKKLLYRNY